MWRKRGPGIIGLSLSGCAYLGRDFATAPIKEHRDQRDDLKGDLWLFREPVRRGLENGYETCTYSYQSYELDQLSDFKHLYVVFNKDNTVRTYSFTGR